MKITFEMQREVCAVLGLTAEDVRTIHLTPDGGYVEMLHNGESGGHSHPHDSDEVCAYTVQLELERGGAA